jgi:HD-like signal output (HDOD) protein
VAILRRDANGLAHQGPLKLDLDAVVASALRLEPLPTSVSRLAVLVSDDDSAMRDIVEVISFDQALTANLLRRANSASSASRSAIKTVHEAVVRLGTGIVLSLAMSTTVGERLSGAIPEYGLGEHELWAHSVRASLAADLLRSRAKVPVPIESSTAALLHDVGKLILARHLGPEILDLLAAAKQIEGLSQAQAEALVLEVNHAELGAVVAQHWRLPDSIVHGIGYHHDPDQCGEPVAFVVHLANLAAHEVERTEVRAAEQTGAGAAEQTGAGEAERDASLRELGIGPESWGPLCATVAARYDELSSRY